MPKWGEPKGEAAEIFQHAFTRITELVAGTEGEKLFLPGDPWFADDDERQALANASLITSTLPSAVALVDACRVEARELLRSHEDVVRALASELLIRRTLDGPAVDLVISRAIAARTADAERKRRAEWRERVESARMFLADVKSRAAS